MTTQIAENPAVQPVSAMSLVSEEGQAKQRIHVALVDDDDLFREAVSTELGVLDFAVTGFADGDELLRFFAEGSSADIIVLDWKLPKQSGPEVLRVLRRRGVMVPVVFLTGHTGETFEKVALDSGALDFVDKSRSADILARRLRLILEAGKRPPELPEDESLHVGRLTLRPNACRAYWDSRDVGLTVTEFNIVKLLASKAGENVTYRAIYDRVHHAGFIAGSGEDGYRTNVRSSIKRIRNKFKAIDPGFNGIENFAGFGYRWEAPETGAPPAA